MSTLPDHQIDDGRYGEGLLYEARPCPGAPDLAVAWITLNNPKAFNAYTTEMVKDLRKALHRASVSREVVAVVLTGAGDKAFCTGGDLNHYVSDYLERPEEFRQYLRLFADAITAILECDRPVINRVNGLRIGGGQELGLACDLTVASDLARFGQAGVRHGSAPIIGATDLLPVVVGTEAATRHCALGEMWTAHQALRHGLVSEAVPVLRDGDVWMPNPLVELDWVRDGRIVFGDEKTGDALKAGKARLKSATLDLSRLDDAVDRLVIGFRDAFPGCVTATIESLRRHKRQHWDANRMAARSWLAMNAMVEARAGFRAFVEAPSKDKRVADHVAVRQALAEARRWTEDLVESVLPR